jgi:glycosyltransferase involved in cell wall biosynthesis
MTNSRIYEKHEVLILNKILVFIPVYNCEKQISRVLNQFDQKVSKYITEVLVVNNRSTDNSENVAINQAANLLNIKITIIRNCDNYGLGGSHKAAFNYAIENEFDHLVVLHGDDQGSIQDLLPYLESGEYKKYDCFLGARFHKSSKLIGYSKFRTFGNYVYNLLFSLVSGKKIYDLGSGLNCYNVRILKDPFYKMFPDDLTFNYCMILASVYYKHSIQFFPLSWREDDQISNVKMTKQAVKVLGLMASYAINKKDFVNCEFRFKKIDSYDSQFVYSNILQEKREGY